MHVGIITYQVAHLKTFQLVGKLMTKDFKVTLYAFPFKYRPPKPSSRYADRPSQILDFDVPDFCARHGIAYAPVAGWGDEFSHSLGVPGAEGTPEVYLHCIAKIVPASFIKNRVFLNCHPGLLPFNRGVDAFKWSIVNDWPIGITLHMIDAEIDRGRILKRMRIPLLRNDSLRDVWQRAYDFEVDLMANFEHHLGNLEHGWDVGDAHLCSHRLIPAETDAVIENLFLQKRERLIELSCDLAFHAHPSGG